MSNKNVQNCDKAGYKLWTAIVHITGTVQVSKEHKICIGDNRFHPPLIKVMQILLRLPVGRWWGGVSGVHPAALAAVAVVVGSEAS